MFERFLRFFVENSRMNYTLFVMVFAVGIWSYNNTAKEIFPAFELDMISIKGSYTGASVDILDKMAVIEIEDNIKSIEGVDVVSTIISPSRFSIIVELKKGYNKYNISNKIKDAVTLIKGNLPDDMDEPSVNVLERTKELIDISLTSSELSTDQMKPFANKFKSKILTIKGVSDATIFGDSDLYFEVLIDEKKITALGLNHSEVLMAISTLSYIFPVGTIEDKNKHFYISTHNGAKLSSDLVDTVIRIGDKRLYLSDIATISKKYEDSATLYSFNGKNALSVAVTQQDTGSAIKIANSISKLIDEVNIENKKANNNITIAISDDNSKRIKDRLNIVVSNIMLGIILITILVVILINWRMSFIIAVGIPTSFVIAAVYFYFSGYTINMISLVGVLIALGIVVDDAIVVSENIQQHIEYGVEPKEAAIKGASEMVKPVSIASLTTLFSFLPILMISGTMGEVMKLIPIAVSALIVASLIESFLFLPIHAAHTLKNGAKVTSWKTANKYYSEIIHFFMRWKKTFLVLFIVIVPVMTVVSLKSSKFQMFPKFDSTDVKISMKANQNTTLENAFNIVQAIEKDLMVKKDDFFIKSIDSVAGYRRDSGNTSENYPYVMYMTVELQELKADNPIDKYITPYLSFYYDDTNRDRTQKSQQIAKRMQKFLDKKDYKTKYNLDDLAILEKKVGPIKSDIKIGLVSQDNDKIVKHIDILTKQLETINGITTISNTVKFGVDEIKLKVNSYGESLGVDEAYVGQYLSNLYMLKKVSVSFDKTNMLDIKIQSKNKDDFKNFKNSEIKLKDGTIVRLNEICEFNVKKSLEKLIKDNGETNFYVFANVNPDIVTASEALEKLEVILEKVREDNVKVILKGEAQKNKELKDDMILASALAIILIMLAMLYLFNSFRETFILMSIIPFSLLGVLIGHKIMGINLSMSAMIGALGLAGVVINDGIIMMTYLKKAKNLEELFYRATKRFRPIIITTVTTLIGMSSLIFFPSGQAVIFQPIAIALGFGLAWGTILNLIYLPVLYSFVRKIK
ncbi:MAG: efflux RND transporter permease subunit [Campylobacterota bacterium]|nr:efflux RND transporter permease subunit [Campylobacterota bacterium]